MQRPGPPRKIRRMWPYHPELLETPVPRYTSFPTAAEFTGAVGPEEMDRALAQTSGDISLYIHIPFCEQICWYCGCNTGASNRRERLASYLDSLHREIAITASRLEGRARVRRVAFGGGSPNAILPADLARLVTALTLQGWLDDPVWSIELDPRTLAPDWGQAIAAIGITQASLGVQTFAPHIQQAIGRIQPDGEIVRATELLRKAGVTSLNFDLMYGLPGQTPGDLEQTLLRSVELGADRIALFGYAHVPHLIPRQQRIDASALPSQAERFAMAGLGFSLLTAAGYVPGDPLAAASREQRLRRNFQGFTDDNAPVLLGMGASAISSFPDLLIQNEKNSGRYRMRLSQGRLPAALGTARSPADQTIGKIIEALLCSGEAVIASVQLAAAGAALAPFAERGLVRIDGNVLRIAADGLPYARTIAALFDPYRQSPHKRFSSAV
jgi:oxygen-independent coproporphyrinogen-3 oxidase